MAGWWSSSRVRHWVMQVSLWAILAGTLALAASLRQHYQHLRRVELADAREVGGFRLRPPVGWTERHTSDGLILEEPASGNQPRRRLEIWHARTDVFLSPVDYLVRSGWDLRLRDTAPLLTGQSGAGESAVRTVRIAGWPGVLISQTRLVTVSGTRQAVPWKQVLACTIVPGGQAILMRLEGEGIARPGDEDVVRQVGQSVALADQPPLRCGGELELAQGIHVAVPGAFATADEQDKFRVARVLLAMEARSWLAVELVPCVLLSGDRPESFPWLVMLRDPLFRPAELRRIDENTWACRGQDDELRPSAAYLRTHPDGRAVLAEFRWHKGSAGEGEPDTDGLWQSLAAGVSFQEPGDIPRLVEAGVAAVLQLPQDPAGLLPAHLREEWQWYHEAVARQQSWTRMQYRFDGKAIGALQATDSSPPLGSSGREISEWQLARDWSGYDYRMARIGSGAVLSQETHVGQGAIRTQVREGVNLIARGGGNVPPLFVPGGVLPLILGRLPFEPMVLRTESVPSPVGWASPAVLTVILEPCFDSPRFLPGKKEPMPCWTVRVNGSGQCSRWYLDDEGRLQFISFAGGVHVHRKEAESAPDRGSDEAAGEKPDQAEVPEQPQ